MKQQFYDHFQQSYQKIMNLSLWVNITLFVVLFPLHGRTQTSKFTYMHIGTVFGTANSNFGLYLECLLSL